MIVKELMTTRVACVKLDTPVNQVADLLHSHGITGLPVINDEGTVLGLITEKELFSADSKLYLPGYVKILQETKFVIGGHKELPYVAEQLTRTSAKDIMNPDVFFATPEMSIEELSLIFVNKDQSPVPVTDSANHLVGIISRSDVIKLLMSQIASQGLGTQEVVLKPKKIRPIDEQLSYVHGDISSRFAFVAKARANVWITSAVVLFIIGFLIGIVYVADPQIINNSIF